MHRRERHPSYMGLSVSFWGNMLIPVFARSDPTHGLFCKRLTFSCGWPLGPAPHPTCFLRPWVSSTGISGGSCAEVHCSLGATVVTVGGGGGGFKRPEPRKVLHGLCTAIVRCMEPWEPPTSTRLAVYRSLSATPDLWVVRHCVMFGDATLDAIGYRGGGGDFHTAVVWYSFPGYPPGAAYTVECRTLGVGVVGAVGLEVGLGICRIGD